MDVSRRDFMKAGGVGMLGLALTGMLSGCGSSSGNAKASVSGNANEVIVSMTPSSEPAAGFDPMFSWGCGEHVHEPLLQSTLITTDKDLNFVNDLATDYTVSGDCLVWTFKIRDDVKFTDQVPLTASDVAFTINTLRNSDTAEADLSMVEKAVATSPTEVEIHLNKPFNAFLYTLAVVGIVPEHAYDSKTYGENPIGSGRYMLEQWDKGQQVIFRANPDYYGEAPKMERVIVLFMEEDASLAAANGGKVDIAYTAATKASANPKDYELFVCDTVDCRGISLPCVPAGGTKEDQGEAYSLGHDVLCNVEVRQALTYGIDRDVMIDNVLNGYGKVCYSVCDGMPWGNDELKCETNRDTAKKIMEDAGWTLGSDGIYQKGDLRASFELWYSASDSVRQALAEEVANQGKEFGFEITTKGGSWDGVDNLYTREFSQAVLWGWGANSPTQLYDLISSDGWGNFSTYESKTIDAHCDAALATKTVEESFDEWKKAQWDGADGVGYQGGASWLWLTNIDHLYFKRPGLNVAEQKPHPHGHGWSLVNNVDQWTW
ncbi:MAG: ABC transporter substrate-binding protein [Anaerotardibacter sp.]